MEIAVLGGCQAKVISGYMAKMTGHTVHFVGPLSPQPDWSKVDLVYTHANAAPPPGGKVVKYPLIVLAGTHPDVVVMVHEGKRLPSPMCGLQSSIVVRAWYEGLTAAQTVSLFNGKTFERLDFFAFNEISKRHLLDQGRANDLPLESMLERWLSRGCFMHTMNHPAGWVMEEVAQALLDREGIPWEPLDDPGDPMTTVAVWPVYPEIAERLGWKGSYDFKTSSSDGNRILGLEELVDLSFAALADQQKDVVLSAAPRINGPRYHDLRALLHKSGARRHPYVGLPERQFWRKPADGDFDPVSESFTIERTDKVSTAGSCFAQHIARALKANGFNYHVTENDPGEGGSNYGVFSARYGNLYTARQLVQTYDRAYGAFAPDDVSWRRGERFVDPFRPEIEPDGFASEAAMLESRKVHLAAVREMFETADIFVFTLGLTEAWRARSDGAAFPLAPGVSGGSFDDAKYEFVNFGAAEVIADLEAFVGRLARVNPKARMILTVSPVPLAATYEPRHVLVSTTYSKSVLRVAAEETARKFPHVLYFPSYEIITGNYNRGAYYADDLRNVTQTGVDHVMRLFLKHFASDDEVMRAVSEAGDVVCEEELLLHAA